LEFLKHFSKLKLVYPTYDWKIFLNVMQLVLPLVLSALWQRQWNL